MAEIIIEVLAADVAHIKNDIFDLKCTVKEQGTAVLTLRDSHMETKFDIKSIKDSQDKMAIDSKDRAKATKDFQDSTLAALQLLKDARGNMWEKLSMTWKVAVIGVLVSLLGSYIWGTVVTIINKYK